LAKLLLEMVRQKAREIREVQKLFARHPDQAIFDSLPGAGNLLAPKLLVMFGDHRERYPTPQTIRALAGACPVTIQSGHKRHVRFRRGCNRDGRRTAQQFAKASVREAEWAAAYLSCCLANRWLGIIWKLWQSRELYDETYHLQQIRRHRRR
jgi:transposase